jgi:hypothetical protein
MFTTSSILSGVLSLSFQTFSAIHFHHNVSNVANHHTYSVLKIFFAHISVTFFNFSFLISEFSTFSHNFLSHAAVR